MWVKFRHKIVFALLRPVFRIFLFFKYGFICLKFKCAIKKPYIILSNHVTTLDPVMLACSFYMPVYFVASDDLFSLKYISPMLKYLVAPIPKTKSSSDLQTIKDCYNIIKQGGTICIFPEGNRNYNGITSHIPFSIVKLVKFLKVPLLLYKIEGGYGVQPRWSDNIRKGRMSGHVQRVICYEEYKDMDDDSLYKYITDSLYSNAFYQAENVYKSNKKAEYAERFLYACPDCGSLCSLCSNGDRIICRNCGLKVKYNENLTLSVIEGRCGFVNVKEWDDFQKNKIREFNLDNITENDVIFTDENILLQQNIRCLKKVVLGRGTLNIYKNRMEITTEKETFSYFISDINSMAVFGKNKLAFYYRDKICQIIGEKRFNALKYVNIYYHIKNKTEGVTDEFLGL